MGRPIALKKQTAMAFPDICRTPVPTPVNEVPIPYPNIAQFTDASDVSDVGNKELLVGGSHVLLEGSKVQSSQGDQAGANGGIKSGSTGGECTITQASASVKYGPKGLGVARLMDPTEQNDGNAAGFVLSANPTVLVGD
jgi:hypothetical protein